MDAILTGYHVNDATWFYLSFLLIVAVFFRFGRLFSLRNLDLGLLLSIAPGLLLIRHQHGWGYVWLFAVTALLLIRAMFDGRFTRRPKLPQNLNPAGMAFLLAAAFAFLMTKVLTEPLPESTLRDVQRAQQMAKGEKLDSSDSAGGGPTSSLIAIPVTSLSQAVMRPQQTGAAGSSAAIDDVAARTLALLSHLAVVMGLVCLAHYHFGDAQGGLAMATLYLLLPCTALDVARVQHVLPAALIVWALVCYRSTLAAGALLGLACGTLLFPVFLLPCWFAFYGFRGGLRFGASLAAVFGALLLVLAVTSSDTQSFMRHTMGEFDWQLLQFRDSSSNGFWSIYPGAYRVPVFVAFLALVVGQTLWPRTKTLSDLIASSTAIVVATQLWYPENGGTYVLWYLPLLLLVIFRPQLANQVAPEIRPWWWRRRPDAVYRDRDATLVGAPYSRWSTP